MRRGVATGTGEAMEEGAEVRSGRSSAVTQERQDQRALKPGPF